ncbi:MAG TPA: polyprenyl synthetase family protein [Candidatus Limnocylindrales bacterium]|nr:polyprenyl synthetase family protein [Candidatus Limnocylindrales bacterium]
MATTTNELSPLLAEIEDEIAELLRSREDDATRPMYDMARYHLGLDGDAVSGGKRFRALLGLLAYEALTGDYAKGLPGAAAVELGHNFSLVHDDIEDRDVERRHRPALWTVYGIAQAINTGDALFVLSRLAIYRLLEMGYSEATVIRLMKLNDETCLRLCEGQFIDIWTSERDEAMSIELYFDMIGRKTASLIAASVHSAAILATDDESVVETFRAFGWAVGIAFQLNDDLLGIWGEEQVTGKEPSDLAKHKKTLPVIYALAHAAADDRERLAAIYALPTPTGDDLAAARAILERTGARDYTRDQAQRYRDEALSHLDRVPVVHEPAREQLRRIVASTISA